MWLIVLPLMFKLSPSVVFQEILAVRGGAKPYYFFRRSTSRLPRDPSSQRWKYVGEKWPMNFAWNIRLQRSIQESFTCRKSTYVWVCLCGMHIWFDTISTCCILFSFPVAWQACSLLQLSCCAEGTSKRNTMYVRMSDIVLKTSA